MSLIEKNNLNYLTQIEQYFVSLKGSGVSLSANDYHLICQWEERGVPLDTVCRALDQGYSEFQNQNPRPGQRISLAYFRTFIEEEIQRTRSL